MGGSPSDPETLLSGRDRFAQTYERDLAREAMWLQAGAANKADSIELLLEQEGLRLSSMLELGCGTGAVTLECQRRGLAQTFTAVDYSATAISHLREQSRGIRCHVGDVMSLEAHDLAGPYDLVVLTHVLEHLEEPRALLDSLDRALRYRYLLLEVPLDDLVASRIKNLVRDRRANSAGHVQFFTRSSFETLVEDAGFEILQRRTYAPAVSLEALDVVGVGSPRSVRRRIQRLTGHHLPRLLGPLWKRFYYGHHAVLCRRPAPTAR